MTEVKPLSDEGNVQLEFGALAPKLSEQRIAGYLSDDDLKRFELIADSLTVVIVHGFMSYTAGTRARDRLAKKIFAAMTPRARAALAKG